ncbi:hypothetical protein DPMN_024812 [Dreissena polymorpha]|uniref:Uncharacterized protein n=1 Tax=Dreissena polymorpha TaxID=45954 RepID=A0A9D4LN43_DREPO|nr:hypothetical protein DPMN_024559 [Dreissena polymorpha]KAH3861860.1 hypothetical protein DPMN_024812 [Dreissena polymorpha]
MCVQRETPSPWRSMLVSSTLPWWLNEIGMLLSRHSTNINQGLSVCHVCKYYLHLHTRWNSICGSDK